MRVEAVVEPPEILVACGRLRHQLHEPAVGRVRGRDEAVQKFRRDTVEAAHGDLGVRERLARKWIDGLAARSREIASALRGRRRYGCREQKRLPNPRALVR